MYVYRFYPIPHFCYLRIKSVLTKVRSFRVTLLYLNIILLKKKNYKQLKFSPHSYSYQVVFYKNVLECNAMQPHAIFTEKIVMLLIFVLYHKIWEGEGDLFFINNKDHSLLLLHKSVLTLSHGTGKNEGVLSKKIGLNSAFFLNLQIDICQS